MNERRNNTDGWRWSDGSLDPPSEKLVWKDPSEPGDTGNGEADCIIQCYGSGKICDARCPSVFANALCEPRSSSGPGTVDVVPSDIVKLSHPLWSEGNGCQKELNKVNFLDCVVECRATNMCATVYFSKSEGKCIMMLYTNANFNFKNSAGWKKFVMK